ncbi:O-antigen ligase family protein [Geodermatophilus sp. CPCC 205761]|uniref:O-antigen ligase family protein n=1 Tax=Geodermatophilus sp. CPCC 205761 TaxID=2936597 RepID=UPI003EEEE11F
MVLSYGLGTLTQAVFLVGLMFVTLVLPAWHRMANRQDISVFLLAPTIISATQNVYLLTVADRVSAVQLQFLIVVNYALAATLLLFLLPFRAGLQEPGRTLSRSIWTWLVILVGYGGMTAAAFGTDPMAAVASLRNLTTPFLFCLLGLYASSLASPARYARMVAVLGVVVVAFGLYELLSPDFWQRSGIAALWDGKGIAVAPGTGLPANFYSSEFIGGSQIRRMAGSFADPVNLGTFLLAALIAAWMTRKWLSMVLITCGVVAAVSKGAILGILVFLTLWLRRRTSPGLFILLSLPILGAAVAMYVFVQDNSTGSTTAHINGLTAAFVELPQHPFGRGLGNIGVLAGLLGQGATSAITESGVGMVIGQLGIVGLVLYTWFFLELARATRTVADPREKLAVIGLLAAFVLNAAFNEVALSPNSAAPYFLLTGLVLGRQASVPIPARRVPPRHAGAGSWSGKAAGRPPVTIPSEGTPIRGVTRGGKPGAR